MNILKYWGICLLIILGCSSYPKITREASQGKLYFHVLFFDPVKNSFYENPLMPPSDFYFYENYAIEVFRNTKQVEDRIFRQDSIYCFIDIAGKNCIEYNKLDTQAKSGRKYKLEDKSYGFRLTPDSVAFENYESREVLKDTTIEGKAFGRFRCLTNAQDEITAYISKTKIKVPLHLNKRVDEDYEGTLLRMDLRKHGTSDQISVRMTIDTNHLSQQEIAVFKKWIKAI